MNPFRFLILLPLIGAILTPVSAQTTPSDGKFAPDQLDQLVAPIALYPDALLSQVLMAASYPLEIVQAQRWKELNDSLAGASLDAAVGEQPWDPSVKSLIGFPETLAMLNGNLEWTQDLGNAVLAQQSEVMDAVQRMRARAQAAGNLATTAEQKVVVEKEIIIVQTASPERVYVPVYSPLVVYGPAWGPPRWYYPWHAYPRNYWYWGRPFGNALTFTTGFVTGALLFGGCDWYGHSLHCHSHGYRHPWYRNNVNVNVNVNNRVAWNHNPVHRHGVRYTNTTVDNRYGNLNTINVNNRPGWDRPNGRPSTRPDINRPTTLPAQRPDLNRPSTRPDINRPTTLPAQRPSIQRPEARPGGGAFSGASSASKDRAASLRGAKSTGSRPSVSKPSSSRPSVSKPSRPSKPSVSKPSRPSPSRGGRR